MNDSRAHLLMRKRDLFAAIRRLDQDRDEGTIDEDAYRAARHRYESEAADILQRIDSLPNEDTSVAGERAPLPLRWKSSKLYIAVAAVLTIGALSVGLASALHSRTDTGSPTVLAPSPGPAAPTNVLSASRVVQSHPRSVAALVALGNAYVQNGQIDAADRTYLAALKVQPSNPDPLTLHAMMLGMANQYQQGLTVLHDVELEHPTFARAWLLDGLFSSHMRNGTPRAIRSWRHFLRLNPHGQVASQVKAWIAAAGHARKIASK